MKLTPINYALNLLALRDRTVAEMKKKMSEKEYSADDIDKTILWLEDKCFLDDERFVDNYIKSQSTNLKAGKWKIQFKLMRLGLDRELIAKYLGEVSSESEYDKAMELAEKWMAKRRGTPTSPNLSSGRRGNEYEKLGAHLAGKGYEISVVKKVLGEVLNS